MAKKHNRKPVVKRFSPAVVTMLFISIVLFCLAWYAVKKFGSKRSSGLASATGDVSSVAQEGGNGGTHIPTGLTEIEDMHGLNNPANILYNSANKWQGQIGRNRRLIGGVYYEYVNFDSLYNGVRAAFKVVRNVYQRLFNMDLSGSTVVDVPEANLAAFYEEYSKTPGTGATFVSLYEKYRKDVNHPLPAMVMAVYRIEKGALYDREIMDFIKHFEFNRVF